MTTHRDGIGRGGALGMALGVGLGLVIFSALTAPCAVAAPAGANKVAQAKAQFERGETFYRQGEFRKALQAYKQALAFKRYPAFLFNIAQCYRQLDEAKQALFFYKLFLSERPNATNKAEVERRIQEMEQKLQAQQAARKAPGRLSVITHPPGAQVFLDELGGPPAATSPATLDKVVPGEHVLVVRLQGHASVTRKVRVLPGKLAVVEVTLKAAAAPRPRLGPGPGPGPTPPAAVVRTAPFYKRWWFWSGVGVTAALAVSSGVFGKLMLDRQAEYNDDSTPIPSLDGIERDAKRFAALCDAFWISAAVVGVATIVGAAIVGMGREEVRPHGTRTLVTPSCSATGCSLVVTGRF